MEYLTLGNSDLQVSRLCMGGCPMGGYGWGAVREQELIDAVHGALECGVTFFDTADTYGLGQSERILGKALGNRRSEAVIATKFGVRVENGRTFYDNSPEYMRRACRESLRRLNTDCIDLYQVHYRDGVTPMGEVVQTFLELREQGLVRFLGLSNLRAEDLAEISAFPGMFVSVQNQYSLAFRDLERDLMLLQEQAGLTPMTWGSLGQGILTGKYGADAVFGSDDRRSREIYTNFHGEKLARNLQIVETMRPIAQAHGVSLAAVAVRFILDRLPSSVVLCGAKRPAQIADSASGLDWHLNEEELATLLSAASGAASGR